MLAEPETLGGGSGSLVSDMRLLGSWPIRAVW